MVNFIKGIDKKVLYIVGGIVAFVILLVLGVFIYRAIFGANIGYSKLEEKISKATVSYLTEKDLLPSVGTNITVDIDDLIENGNLKELDNYTKDTCVGEVTVMNNGGEYLYLPSLQCSEYTTNTLASQIIKDNLVTSGAGLYHVGDEYIFKGKTVNNYIKFGNIVWRILKIDSNGNIRVIKLEPETDKLQWDNKYNVNEQSSVGINDYENSLILEFLTNSYKKISTNNKKHLVAHNACVYKRSNLDLSVSSALDCSVTLDNQYISLINTSDFANASLDPNCDSIVAKSCVNYNYLYYVVASSWTTNGFADNTYEVVSLNGGVHSANIASDTDQYHWVIYLSGLEKFGSGTGTAKDPYIVK